MKIFHTADWHLGKIVQGVHMTEDQQYILDEFIQAIENERPDAIIIAGDLYDRSVPPADAVNLLDDVLKKIVLELDIPVMAIAGNHDSPGRLDFASHILRDRGLHLVGKIDLQREPVILHDEHGPIYFHLVPYADPSMVRHAFDDDAIRTHDEAMQKIVEHMTENHWDDAARHVFVGHAFVTPHGEKAEKTSDSELTLSIGGAEFVQAKHFSPFHYTALGHLHRAHHVRQDSIQYAGSILKYSISEKDHNKGFTVVELDGSGEITLERRPLVPRRDVRRVEMTMAELLQQPINHDYVFVRLTDETPILYPMEKVRSIFPNALHVERKHSIMQHALQKDTKESIERTKMNDHELFRSFYEDIKGIPLPEETDKIFAEVLNELLQQTE